MTKGVIFEYDYVIPNGPETLFAAMTQFFKDLDNISYDHATEARWMAGKNFQKALAEFIPFVKTKKTVQKTARDIPVYLQKFYTNKILADGVDPKFVKLVKALEEKGVKVVIATRADTAKVASVFADVVSDNVKLYHFNSATYGNVKWDAWGFALKEIGTDARMTYAVTGSGFGVKSAMQAKHPAVGIITPHTEWQDYSGADLVLPNLVDAACQKKFMAALKLS